MFVRPSALAALIGVPSDRWQTDVEARCVQAATGAYDVAVALRLRASASASAPAPAPAPPSAGADAAADGDARFTCTLRSATLVRAGGEEGAADDVVLLAVLADMRPSLAACAVDACVTSLAALHWLPPGCTLELRRTRALSDARVRAVRARVTRGPWSGACAPEDDVFVFDSFAIVDVLERESRASVALSSQTIGSVRDRSPGGGVASPAPQDDGIALRSPASAAKRTAPAVAPRANGEASMAEHTSAAGFMQLSVDPHCSFDYRGVVTAVHDDGTVEMDSELVVCCAGHVALSAGMIAVGATVVWSGLHMLRKGARRIAAAACPFTLVRADVDDVAAAAAAAAPSPRSKWRALPARAPQLVSMSPRKGVAAHAPAPGTSATGAARRASGAADRATFVPLAAPLWLGDVRRRMRSLLGSEKGLARAAALVLPRAVPVPSAAAAAAAAAAGASSSSGAGVSAVCDASCAYALKRFLWHAAALPGGSWRGMKERLDEGTGGASVRASFESPGVHGDVSGTCVRACDTLQQALFPSELLALSSDWSAPARGAAQRTSAAGALGYGVLAGNARVPLRWVQPVAMDAADWDTPVLVCRVRASPEGFAVVSDSTSWVRFACPSVTRVLDCVVAVRRYRFCIARVDDGTVFRFVAAASEDVTLLAAPKRVTFALHRLPARHVAVVVRSMGLTAVAAGALAESAAAVSGSTDPGSADMRAHDTRRSAAPAGVLSSTVCKGQVVCVGLRGLPSDGEGARGTLVQTRAMVVLQGDMCRLAASFVPGCVLVCSDACCEEDGAGARLVLGRQSRVFACDVLPASGASSAGAMAAASGAVPAARANAGGEHRLVMPPDGEAGDDDGDPLVNDFDALCARALAEWDSGVRSVRDALVVRGSEANELVGVRGVVQAYAFDGREHVLSVALGARDTLDTAEVSVCVRDVALPSSLCAGCEVALSGLRRRVRDSRLVFVADAASSVRLLGVATEATASAQGRSGVGPSARAIVGNAVSRTAGTLASAPDAASARAARDELARILASVPLVYFADLVVEHGQTIHSSCVFRPVVQRVLFMRVLSGDPDAGANAAAPVSAVSDAGDGAARVSVTAACRDSSGAALVSAEGECAWQLLGSTREVRQRITEHAVRFGEWTHALATTEDLQQLVAVRAVTCIGRVAQPAAGGPAGARASGWHVARLNRGELPTVARRELRVEAIRVLPVSSAQLARQLARSERHV